MKNLVIIITMFIFASSAFADVSKTKTERYANKTSAIQYPSAFVAAPPSVHYKVATSASFDPFTTKTNKYAETKLISVIANKPILVKFSAAGTAVASTDSEYYIASSTRDYFAVDESYPYVRIISVDGTSATIYVTEIK